MAANRKRRAEAQTVAGQPRLRHFIWLTALLSWHLPNAFAQSPSFRYFYDDAHRLFRVLDSTGNLIEYDYDRTGNITKVGRSTVAPNSPAILNISPLTAGPSRTITIYGQNFNPTAAGDQVTINGVIETVLSATANTLVVQLAPGTASGPISVTVNGITATSGTLQLLGTPGITSVSPDGGPANKTTTVAVTGSLFTGATFSLPGGGTVTSVVITDDSHATLQIAGQTPGAYPIVATNSAGASNITVTPANRFYVIAEPGGAYSAGVSVLNQAWISADIPNPGSITPIAAQSSLVSVLNQAWISADIPSPGNIAYLAAQSSLVSVLNQAWISADIPSPGNLDFADGLLVTVNNTATTGPMSFDPVRRVKTIGSGSSIVPVDLTSVHDGDRMIEGQTVRFRVYPSDRFLRGELFLNGIPTLVQKPFEVLVTAPANVTSLDLQAVIDTKDGSVARMPAHQVEIVSDPGATLSGHAVLADGRPAVSTPVGVRVNGLAAEYFQANRGQASWSDLDRVPGRRGFVTAINQPDTTALGADPLGTGISGDYAARFRGEIFAADTGEHAFFLTAPLGARLIIDGHLLLDTPAGQSSPDLQTEINLTAGWHAIEVDSYHDPSTPGIQLSWKQPDSEREIVRPDRFATDLGLQAVTDANGQFQMGPFPVILNPLEAHSNPADPRIRVVLDQFTAAERPIPK
jgi:YD repeat-containing protein